MQRDEGVATVVVRDVDYVSASLIELFTVAYVRKLGNGNARAERTGRSLRYRHMNGVGRIAIAIHTLCRPSVGTGLFVVSSVLRCNIRFIRADGRVDLNRRCVHRDRERLRSDAGSAVGNQDYLFGNIFGRDFKDVVGGEYLLSIRPSQAVDGRVVERSSSEFKTFVSAKRGVAFHADVRHQIHHYADADDAVAAIGSLVGVFVRCIFNRQLDDVLSTGFIERDIGIFANVDGRVGVNRRFDGQGQHDDAVAAGLGFTFGVEDRDVVAKGCFGNLFSRQFEAVAAVGGVLADFVVHFHKAELIVIDRMNCQDEVRIVGTAVAAASHDVFFVRAGFGGMIACYVEVFVRPLFALAYIAGEFSCAVAGYHRDGVACFGGAFQGRGAQRVLGVTRYADRHILSSGERPAVARYIVNSNRIVVRYGGVPFVSLGTTGHHRHVGLFAEGAYGQRSGERNCRGRLDVKRQRHYTVATVRCRCVQGEFRNIAVIVRRNGGFCDFIGGQCEVFVFIVGAFANQCFVLYRFRSLVHMQRQRHDRVINTVRIAEVDYTVGDGFGEDRILIVEREFCGADGRVNRHLNHWSVIVEHDGIQGEDAAIGSSRAADLAVIGTIGLREVAAAMAFAQGELDLVFTGFVPAGNDVALSLAEEVQIEIVVLVEDHEEGVERNRAAAGGQVATEPLVDLSVLGFKVDAAVVFDIVNHFAVACHLVIESHLQVIETTAANSDGVVSLVAQLICTLIFSDDDIGSSHYKVQMNRAVAAVGRFINNVILASLVVGVSFE